MRQRSVFTVLMLRVVAIVVMLPVTLLAGVYGLLALGLLVSFVVEEAVLSIEDMLRRVGLAVLLGGGWFGIVTGWRLYYHFLKSFGYPRWSKWAWAGLLSGTLCSVVLLVITGQLFMLWPLLGAAWLAGLLLNAGRNRRSA
ncbi:putative membrane bound phosphohydrolase [Pseudomonas sp. StFLB209]|uniref:hypothetical protein n=1 Tax=Pseudomonas sp. StFLB209 TaxID=1028989 RepID=UPI0004F6A9AF|nr:hypothetical protein [Pseudomonas sp. StFLB209]BAP45414.1 putative membrane bound phosphohydrolase [Pseudomonas sp. StFLB209]